jgi:tetratricopeptide (TPR) repeat protein
MMVLGGGQKAQECYMNAEMAASNLPGVGRSLLEACDYTLEYAGRLSIKDRAATLANRGIVHAALNNYDEAMNDYNMAIEMRPSTPEFFINRGNSYFMMRNYAEALNDYESSLGFGLKQLHFAHYNMGMTYERLGNDLIAQREYQLALEYEPDWSLANKRLQIVQQRLAEDLLEIDSKNQ